MQAGSAPKVSVCVITYNHRKYIRQCLQSIVDQKTDFPFEVVVSDDASKDGTAEIVKEFAENYPDRIVSPVRDDNIGGHENFLLVHNLARGEYVAHCDGDDFFLPGKLQMQSDYMDAHADCSLTYTRARIFNDRGERWESANSLPRIFPGNRFTASDLLRLGSIGIHSTLMYRRSSRKTRHPDFMTLDYFYAIEYSLAGYGYYFDDVLAAYRYNENAGTLTTSSSNRDKSKKLIASHQQYYAVKAPQFKKYIFIGVLTCFIIESINFRSSAFLFAKNILNLFTPISLSDLYKNLKQVRFFRIRRARRTIWERIFHKHANT